MPAKIPKPPREELDRMYNVENMSPLQIGKHYLVSGSTARRWIIEDEIEVRSIGEAQLPKGFVPPSGEELYRLHHEEGWHVSRIARHYGVSDPKMASLMDDLEIKRRDWQDLGYTICEANKFLEEHSEYQELPSQRVLNAQRYVALLGAINRHHGGFPAFRELMRERNGQPSSSDQLESLLENYASGGDDE